MSQPYVNLNWLGGVAMTAVLLGIPAWLVGLISARLLLVMAVFFAGILVLSNWADSQNGN